MGPKLLGGLPRPRRLTSAELSSIDARRSALLDTRTWKEYREGHVPCSLYLPLNASFPTDAGSFLSEGEEIHLILEESRVEEAVRDLVRIGLDDVVGWFPPDELSAWAAASGALVRSEFTDVAGARKALSASEYFPLDVRRASEFEQGHIDAAKNISHTRLAAHLDEIPKDRPILVNCKSGARSARATSLLERNGLRAVNLEGGFDAWRHES
jgi:hydroxyacylglutathione hydrolase